MCTNMTWFTSDVDTQYLQSIANIPRNAIVEEAD